VVAVLAGDLSMGDPGFSHSHMGHAESSGEGEAAPCTACHALFILARRDVKLALFSFTRLLSALSFVAFVACC